MPRSTRLSSKGQVVIPADVRARLDLRPGTELEVLERPGELVLRKKPQRRRMSVDDFIAKRPTFIGPPITLEDIDQAVATAVLARQARGQ
jgi:AbrB family looped-hinge helix DNA binding protein